MEGSVLLQRRTRVQSSLSCATISIAQKPQQLSCDYRLPKVSAENSKNSSQYRRARTAVSLDNPVTPSGEKVHIRRSVVTMTAPDVSRETKSAGRARSDTVGPAEGLLTPVDIPVAQRSLEERLLNPDRLSLDRRGLTACPLVQGEENLRLLNLQHNNITQLRHLSALRKLIFLDLYDNRIERISGLTSLRALRVLMLGKNRVSCIEGLETLEHLDVLDLHSNEIENIENLCHLSDLRVLNLAGNRIRTVSNLHGMRALTELNLRRNRVRTLLEIDQLPNLEKLFLSHNDLSSWSQLDILAQCRCLLEVTLDGNAVSREVHYRLAAIQLLTQVKFLDGKRITDEERRLALAWSKREDDRKKELGRIAAIKDAERVLNSSEKRRQVLSNAKRQWELSSTNLWGRSSRVMRIPDLYSAHMNRPSTDTQGSGASEEGLSHPEKAWSQEEARTAGQKEAAEVRAAVSEMMTDVATDKAQKSSAKVYPQRVGGDEDYYNSLLSDKMYDDLDIPEITDRPINLAEIRGQELILVGSTAFSALDTTYVKDVAQSISGIVFKSIPFDAIFENLSKLRAKYPNITSLTFFSADIRTYGQLSKLSQIKRLDSITIEEEGNPVTKLRYWRQCLLAIMAHANLKKINSTEVSDEDWDIAEMVFGNVEGGAEAGKLSAAAVGRHPRDGANPKTQNHKNIAKELCRIWRLSSLSVDRNRTMFGQTWPQMVHKMVRRAVEDILTTGDTDAS